MTPMQIERARAHRAALQPMGDVLAAVARAMAGVKRIAKDGRNKHDGYNFASVDSFLEAIGPVLSDAGLIVCMDETGCEGFERQGKYGPTSWLRFAFRFTVYHSSGQSLPPTTRTVEVIRSGAQAYGSAQSYALKQFLRALLMVPTGDAEDADYGEKGDGPVSAPRAAPKSRQQAEKVSPDTYAIAFAVDCLNAAETVEALAEVWGSLSKPLKAAPAVVKAKNDRKAALSKPANETAEDQREPILEGDQIPY